MINISAIPAFADNYIWCIYDDETRQALVVDPGSHTDVTKFLEAHNLNLSYILITHHHPDHVGGVAKLKQLFNCEVYASSQSKVAQIDIKLSDYEEFDVMGIRFTGIDVPGHTLDHNAYYCADLNALFCGDTLFSGGCGRLFEGSAEQMYKSLQKFQSLPEQTKVYCAHEYTLANLEFATHLMPQNSELQSYQKKVQELRNAGTPTIPTELRIERNINPFLRAFDPELYQEVLKTYPDTPSDELSVFTATRLAKDNF